ncbi:ATP-dependent dethiobiotin synthetase BioD 1 [Methyloligella halotolerans]|uniref:ATP-dependent dethiobiotin synthetase BioD n=1 Tax=Methyloligella halotolerans TaxID=1177755 RepID=A0A1E2S351_9HYPH|nr:dethiobiotin synthase [Methyloligella halotolerans]ODA68937.1 ATP-dependent dethiobiotin synthetase BioD 1 [Methyloligella halotolerans]
MSGFFVTGTDTDVGKTVVAAWLTAHLGATYWKPIQAGEADGTDTKTVRALAELPDERVIPESYVLPDPLSPHESARRAGVTIDLAAIRLPEIDNFLVVEGAGGLMVPLNDSELVIDLIEDLGLPSILVARSTLGTINHTLLSLEALRRRGLAIAGVVMVGPESDHNRAAIERYGRTQVIAEIPWLDPLDRQALCGIAPELDLAKLAQMAK